MKRSPLLPAGTILFVCGLAVPATAQWIPNYQVYSIQRIGLYGPDHTNPTGEQRSEVLFLNSAGQVTGSSERYTGAYPDWNGRDAWVWNGTSSKQIGLTGGVYTGPQGHQFSEVRAQNAAGQVTGSSYRDIDADGGAFGRDAWVWNGTTTTQIGLTGPDYINTTGSPYSEALFQNNVGQVAGYSSRGGGRDSWVWNGTTTTQIGLIGPGYTGPGGVRDSIARSQNGAGQVAGFSQRYSDAGFLRGQDTWAWNGTTTTQISPSGGVYTSGNGSQHSEMYFQNDAGQVVGISNRYAGMDGNGQDAWAWNGTTTTQIGFTGAGYTDSSGYQRSEPHMQNAAGQVVGISSRITDSGENGHDAWVWNGTTSTQIGFTGPGYTASNGYQESTPWLLNAAGQVVGYSKRLTANAHSRGEDAWVWNGTTTTQIGLTGPGFNVGGNQRSVPNLQNDSGQVVGTSWQYPDAGVDIGQVTWVWNGTVTIPISLSGGVYTNGSGVPVSWPQLQSDDGQVVGYSHRFTSEGLEIGQDAWYFDPITMSTSAIIGSVRTIDSFAFSVATILTDGGFLLGNYTYFDGGVGEGMARAFIFRPDLGLTDLGDLVNGGLTISGWSTLQRPIFSDALNTIVGYGYVNGQTSGQSVFVMTIPGPGAGSVLGLSLLLASRRSRR